MVKYECSTCNREFQRKGHLEDHLNKKNKCKPLIDNLHEITPILHEITPILHENTPKLSLILPLIVPPVKHDILASVEVHVCNYCNKTFSRKNVVYKHIKESCKVAKQQNKEKQDIFDKLKLERDQQEVIVKLKLLEEQNKTIITINKQLEEEIKNKNTQLEEENKQLKKAIKKVQPITNNTMNNTMNNNTTNIIMVSYGQEDLSKITPKMLSNACKKGYNSIVQLVEMVHFNPSCPEFHNVYIPSVKDKHAMVYYDETWNLKNKDDVVNDMYDNNRDFIMENLEGINNFLNDGEKRALNRWIDSEKNKGNSEKDKKAIACTHENLKLLLHNKRHIPVGTRKQKAMITL